MILHVRTTWSSCPVADATVLGKSYYSMTPFRLGPAAVKFALKSDLRVAEPLDHKKESLKAGLATQIAVMTMAYDLRSHLGTKSLAVARRDRLQLISSVLLACLLPRRDVRLVRPFST